MLVVLIAVLAAAVIVAGFVGIVRTRRRPDAEPAPSAVTAEPAVAEEPVVVAPVKEVAPPRLRDRLGKARALVGGYLAELRLRAAIDDQVWDELEEMLIVADVGVSMTATLLDDLRAQAREQAIASADALIDALRADVAERLRSGDQALAQVPGDRNVWMFVGVNGTGKTTTIGKVAEAAVADGASVVLIAADTFRAAAADQLGVWAERAGAQLVRGQEGADPGSVVFDGMDAAAGRDASLVLVDTAGRLHTKVNLMEELKKLRRIVDRTPGALKEVLLVIDATTGQNGLAQARQFSEAVDVTGVVLTKLDGTAKGGIVLAIQHELGIPVKLVGVGEGVGDLLEFDPDEFAGALFA
ncbi:MAG: signal recognition particle-docking protein FtsY [Actinobacteria bacterium]|nr:signal recognition particle-docking protein FtsY [Actinomycetota bacterium]